MREIFPIAVERDKHKVSSGFNWPLSRIEIDVFSSNLLP
jgi:hypothetical protein